MIDAFNLIDSYEEEKKKKKKNEIKTIYSKQDQELLDWATSYKAPETKKEQPKVEPPKQSIFQKAKDTVSSAISGAVNLGKNVLKTLDTDVMLFGKPQTLSPIPEPVKRPEAIRMSDEDYIKVVPEIEKLKLDTVKRIDQAEKELQAVKSGRPGIFAKPSDKGADNAMREVQLSEELPQLKKQLSIYDQFLGKEQIDRGFVQALWEGIKNPGEMVIPFAKDVKSIDNLVKQYDTVQAYKSGEKLNNYQQSVIKTMQAEAINKLIDKGLGYKVGEVVTNLPHYMLEFAMTGGVFNIAKAGTTKIIGKVAQETMPQVATNIVSSSIGAIAQNTALVPQWSNRTLEYMIPQYELVQGKSGDKLIQKIGGEDDFKTALKKGYLSNLVETATERIGVVVEKPTDFIMKAVLSKFGAKTGAKTVSELMKLAEKAGWNGIVGEVFEEEVGEVLQAPIDQRKYYNPFTTKEGQERLLVETLGIGAFGGIGGVADVTISKVAENQKKAGNVINLPVENTVKEKQVISDNNNLNIKGLDATTNSKIEDLNNADIANPIEEGKERVYQSTSKGLSSNYVFKTPQELAQYKNNVTAPEEEFKYIDVDPKNLEAVEGKPGVFKITNKNSVPQQGSIEQLAEEKAGFKPGIRKQFDTALFNKNAEEVKRLLPEVPEEYKKRFESDINNLIEKKPKIKKEIIIKQANDLIESGSKVLEEQKAKNDEINTKLQNYSSEDLRKIASIKKMTQSKEGQAGDIETLYKKNPQLVSDVVNAVRVATNDYLNDTKLTDEQALDIALKLPNKTDINKSTPEEIKQARQLLKENSISIFEDKTKPQTQEEFEKQFNEANATLPGSEDQSRLSKKEAERLYKNIDTLRSVESKKELPTGGSNKGDTVFSPQEPVGTGKLRKSQAYQRVIDRLDKEVREDVSYNKLILKKDAEDSMRLVMENPKKAYLVAKGLDAAPKGMTETAISIALADRAGAEGNYKLQAELEASRSLRQTRRGQEIVSERGRFDENSPYTYIRQLIDMRMQEAGKSLTEGIEKGIKKPKAYKSRVTERVDQQVRQISQRMNFEEAKIQSAQEIIDSLICT